MLKLCKAGPVGIITIINYVITMNGLMYRYDGHSNKLYEQCERPNILKYFVFFLTGFSVAGYPGSIGREPSTQGIVMVQNRLDCSLYPQRFSTPTPQDWLV